jgi:O-antigen ligase
LSDPFFGVGLGNFEVQYQDYSRQIGLDTRRVPRTPASLYLEVLSQQGLIGVLSFSLLIYTIFAGLRSARLQFAYAGMQDQANMTMALVSGFVGYMIAATVKNSAYSNVYWILVGMALSAAQVALFSAREKSELSGHPKAL